MQIATKMLEGLRNRTKGYYMTPLDVQLRHVDLPDSYEGMIRRIESIKLDQRKAMEERSLDLAKERNHRATELIRMDTVRLCFRV